MNAKFNFVFQKREFCKGRVESAAENTSDLCARDIQNRNRTELLR